MGVISTAMATWRTALAAAPASLTNLPQNIVVEDLPDTDKTYFAVLMGDSGGEGFGPEAGSGGVYEDTAEVRVVVTWFLDIDQEAHAGTIADDVQNVRTVMLDDDNKGTDVMLISPLAWGLERKSWGVQGTLRFNVRFRVSADLT